MSTRTTISRNGHTPRYGSSCRVLSQVENPGTFAVRLYLRETSGPKVISTSLYTFDDDASWTLFDLGTWTKNLRRSWDVLSTLSSGRRSSRAKLDSKAGDFGHGGGDLCRVMTQL